MRSEHTSEDGQPTADAVLGRLDAEALDALVQAGWDPRQISPVTSADVRRRAERLARLLAPMEHGTDLDGADRAGLILRRIGVDSDPAAGVSTGGVGDVEGELHPEDRAAVDALVESGHELDLVPQALRDRAAKAHGVGELVRHPLSEERAGGAGNGVVGSLLVERTLARVAAMPRGRSAMAAGGGGGGVGGGVGGLGGGWRLREVGSIAAVAVLGVSLLWPTMASVRSAWVGSGCRANMQAVASAMSRYAGDARGDLPMVDGSVQPASVAGFSGAADRAWWNVGRVGESNSANLFTLPRLGYATLDDLACGGNAMAQRAMAPGDMDWGSVERVSYSYHVMFGPRKPRWESAGASIAVLADASPVVRQALSREVLRPLENTRQHGGRGQNVLRADGSVVWMTSPTMPGSGPVADNIWLPRSLEEVLAAAQREVDRRAASGGPTAALVRIELRGRELPTDERDGFLGP